MKSFRKILVLFLSGLFLIVAVESCENSENVVLKNEEFVNPFDFIGKIHNEGLDYVIKKIDFNKKQELIFEDVCKLTSEFMLSNEDYNFMRYSSEQYKEMGISLALNYLDRKMYPADILLLKEGTQENEYLKKVLNAFSTINFDNTESSFKVISNLESEIWSSGIDENQKYILLVMSVVGKYSLNYWVDYLSDIKDYPESKRIDLRRVAVRLLEADMEGALLGFISGGIVGAIGGTALMPGVGTITAAIVSGVQGSAYGAVIGSCWSGFKMLVFE